MNVLVKDALSKSEIANKIGLKSVTGYLNRTIRSLLDSGSIVLTEGDTKGDLYEYLLSKLTTAGINGQFRTPRHIIRKMVEIVE